MRVCVDGVRLQDRLVFQQPVEDVNGLPDPASNKAREERNVGVGDVVIGDAPVSSVSNVALAEEVVFDEFDVRTVGDGDLFAAPKEGQFEAGVLFDHVFQG